MKVKILFLLFIFLKHFIFSQPSIIDTMGCAGEDVLPSGQVTQVFNLTKGANELGLIHLKNPVKLDRGFVAPLRVNLGDDGAGKGMTLLLFPQQFSVTCKDTSAIDNYLNTQHYLAIKIETSGQMDNIHVFLKQNGVLVLDQKVAALPNGTNIEDGETHRFTILWNKNDNEFVITIDGYRRFCETLDLADFLKNSPQWYLGMAAETTMLPDTQKVGIEGSEPSNQCCPEVNNCFNAVDLKANAYQVGHAEMGHWLVDPTKPHAVTQKTQLGPTFYGVPLSLLNVAYSFDVTVAASTSITGDFGFYIGDPPSCTKPDQFDLRLFRWRGTGGTLCNGAYDGGSAGYLLAHLKETISLGCGPGETSQYFWQNTGPGFTKVPPLNVPDMPWVRNKTYHFRVVYRYDSLNVFIDDILVAAEKGDCFKAGRFGFYTMNQAEVRFNDLSYEYLPTVIFPSKPVCPGEAIELRQVNRCQLGFDSKDIEKIKIDFGDFSRSDSLSQTTRHIYNQPGIYEITVSVTNAAGCEGTVDKAVEVLPPLEVPDFETIPTSCYLSADGQLHLHPEATQQYEYSFDSLSFKADTQYNGFTAGQYPIYWRSTAGCTGQSSFVITQPDSFYVRTSIKNTMFVGDTARVGFLRVIPDGRVYTANWSGHVIYLDCITCPRPYFRPLKEGDYTLVLTVTDTFGCVADDTLRIHVQTRPDYIYTPNAFAPRGENDYNHYFTLFAGPEVKQITIFRVFDRWGNCVHFYEGTNNAFVPGDPGKGWRGNFKDDTSRPCPAGVYVYYIEYETIWGEKKVKYGNVTLIR